MNDIKTIMLVEDNENDEILTLRALKDNNLANKIVVARDGQEAIDMLLGKDGEEPALCPQLILLDLKLPKYDGLEVLRKIRDNECTRLIPVVILTSSSEEEDILSSYKLGANSYIRKPVDFDQFVVAIKQLKLYWLVLNELPK